MGHGAQPGIERLDLGACLPVHAAQQRLAEVGQVRARETPDEALGADDADLDAADLAGRPIALEQVDAGVGEDRAQLVDAVGVPVVVAQDGEHRHLQRAARVGQHPGLLGLAVGGPVAGQQDEIGVPVELRERGADPMRVRS